MHFAVNFIFLPLALFVKLSLFVVVLVFESQEVLIERDTISKQRFIAGRFIFLVNLSILELLDLQLHRRDLLLQVVDVLDVQVVSDFSVLGAGRLFLLPLALSFEV